ncbi:MAG: flippase-like protein [Chloroflexi bacterium]|nr:flippase-like protein [Chloroflexota bacterium]
MTRRAWIVGIVLTAVLLGLTLRDIKPDEFLASLGRGQYGWVGAALLVTVVGYLLRVARWRTIVGPRFDSRLAPYTAVIVGFAVNNLFPARLGEFVRAYIGAKHSDQRKTFFLATIVLERILDGLTLVGILTVVSLFTELPFEIRTLQVVGALLFVAAAVTVWLAARMEAHALRFMGLLLRFLPQRIYRWADLRVLSFLTGFARIRQPSDLLKLGAYSIAVWTCEMTAYALIMRVFSVTPSGIQSVSAPAFLLSVVNLFMGPRWPPFPLSASASQRRRHWQSQR